MESKLFKLAASQGIWAVLSIALIFYILKAQEKRDLNQEIREKGYQDIITKLTKNLNIVGDIKSDVKDIKSFISKK
jgi:hypothetical protein